MNNLKNIEKKTQNNYNKIRKQGNLKLIEAFSDSDSDVDSVFSDDKSIQSVNSSTSTKSIDFTDSSILFKNGEKFKNGYNNSEVRSTNESDSFISQFQDLRYDNINEPVSFNNSNDNTNVYSSKEEVERDLALNGGYSHINSNDMTYNTGSTMDHINMMPNFSSRRGYGNRGVEQRDNFIQRKTELFTGNLSNVDYQKRRERAPLFNPSENTQNLHGMYGITDKLEYRYMPGREKRGEMPFEPDRITPGVGLEANEKSTGIHDTYRPTPKTIDDLRTANKKQISYSQPVVRGVIKSQLRRGLRPEKVYKRRPERFGELDKPVNKKYTGNEAQKIRENFKNRNTQRSIRSKELFGGAFNKNIERPKDRDVNIKLSGKISYLTDRAGHISASGQKKTSGDIDTYYISPTLKDVHVNNKYIGLVKSEKLGKAYNDETYICKTNNKRNNNN